MKAGLVIKIWSAITLLSLITLAFATAQTPKTLQELSDYAQVLSKSNPDSALAVYKEMHRSAVEMDSVGRSAYALYEIGIHFMGNGQFDSAVHYLTAATDQFEIEEDYKGLTLTNVSLGNIDNFRGQIENAIQFYHTALDFSILNQDTFSQTRILNNLGAAYNSAGRIQQALLTLEEGLRLAEQIDNPALLGDINNNFATNHEALKAYDQAVAYGEKAADYYKLAGDKEYEALALTNLAAYLLAMDTLDAQAIQSYLHEGKAILNSIYSPAILTNYYRQLSHFNYRTGNYPEARAAADTCLRLLDEFPNLQGTAQIFERLYTIHKAEGDLERALEYHEQFMAVRDSLVFAQSNHQLQELEARYQLAAKDARLASQELEITRRTGQRNLYFGIVLGLLALGAFFLYRQRQKAIRMQDQVALQHEQIENLKKQQQIIALDHLLQGQEDERKRIAQDLHDGLGGLLSTVQVRIRHMLGSNPDQTNSSSLHQSEKLIDEACQEVRRIAHDMMPGALIKIGLIAAISDLIDTYAQSTRIDFHFTAPVDELEISDRQSIGIYRIIQEILHNTVKYARCSRFDLSIEMDDGQIRIRAADDGLGFDPEQVRWKKGLGIQGIEGRVDRLGGSLLLTTQPGRGVKYEIQIPGFIPD